MTFSDIKIRRFLLGIHDFPYKKKKNELETTLIAHDTIYILKDNDTLECAEYYQDTYRIIR